MNRTKLVLLTTAVMATAAAGYWLPSSNIDPANKFSWDENSGWMNWLDADGGASGVVVASDHLSGYIWSESNGWINVGNGGGPYANTDDTDYGVNILGDTDLDGFAWDENGGWINFGWGAAGNLVGRAQFDGTRFLGYAWGENDGWINLDDGTHYVAATTSAIACTGCVNNTAFAPCNDNDACTMEACTPGFCDAPCDLEFGDVNGDTVVNFGDVFEVLDAIGNDCLCPACDVDSTACTGDGVLNFGDVFEVLDAIGAFDAGNNICGCGNPGATCP